MADPAHMKRGLISKILGRPVQGTPTAALPDELLTDADLEAIPEDRVDDGMVPILGQYVERTGPTFDPLGGRGAEVDYSQTEAFQATPDDRALAGEGPAGRVTGNIISRGEAPEAAFAQGGDPYAEAWWNDPDALENAPLPTPEAAVSEAMFDFSQPMSWGGGGGWNYQYQPDPEDGKLGYILATDPKTGRTIKVEPGTEGREPGSDAFAAIMTELHREGTKPLNSPEAAPAPVEAPAPAPQSDPENLPPLAPNESLQEDGPGYQLTTPTNTMPVHGPLTAEQDARVNAPLGQYEGPVDPLADFDAVTGGKYGESGAEQAPYTMEDLEAMPAAEEPWPDMGGTRRASVSSPYEETVRAHRQGIVDRLREEQEFRARERARLAALQEPIDWTEGR